MLCTIFLPETTIVYFVYNKKGEWFLENGGKVFQIFFHIISCHTWFQAIAFEKKKNCDLYMYIYASMYEILGWSSNRIGTSDNYGRPCQIV